MSITTKRKSDLDGNQALQSSFNDVDSTLSVNGFIVGKVGHRVTLTIGTDTVANDQEDYSFYDNSELLYTIRVIYTTGTRDVLKSAERIA